MVLQTVVNLAASTVKKMVEAMVPNLVERLADWKAGEMGYSKVDWRAEK